MRSRSGRDLESALELNRDAGCVLPGKAHLPDRHYLGKEAGRDLSTPLREPLEPILNRAHIRRVQITMADEFG